MVRKLPIVGVFGQGTPIDEDQGRLAYDVGAFIARLGAHLLTGGGFATMETAAKGFVEVSGRPGFSIGIVPCQADGPFDAPNRAYSGQAYPNSFVEIAIMTPLAARSSDWRREPNRNHINVLTPDAIVCLPGNSGTRNELDMSAEYRGEKDLPREARRVVLVGPVDRFTEAHRRLYVHAATLVDAEAHVRRVLGAHGFEARMQP